MRAKRTPIPQSILGILAIFVPIMGCSGSSSDDGGGTASGGALGTGTTTSSGGASPGTVAGVGGRTAQSATAASGGVISNAGGAKNMGGQVAAGGATGPKSTVISGSGGQASVGGSTNSPAGGVAGTPAAGGKSAAGGASPSTGGTSSTPAGGSTGAVVCPSSVLSPGDSNKTVTAGGLSREYIQHVPSAYKGNAPVPLLIDFHPIGGSASQWRTGSPYPAVVDGEGVITLYPNGKTGPMGNAWNIDGCCVTGAPDDVAFAKAMVTEVSKVACIDPKRVYAVGFSMGGGFSNYLACHAADVFAAVGPAAFDLTEQNVTGCKPSRPITVVEWRGTNDSVVSYSGGHSAVVTGMAIDFLGAVKTFEKWASLDQCTGSPSAADSNNCQTYSNCGGGVQVTLCTAKGGGHEAAKASVVWPMLKKYTLP